MDICNHDVLVAVAGFDGETSCLVGGELSRRLGDFDGSEDYLVGSGAALLMLSGRRHFGGRWLRSFGASEVLADYRHVAFGGFYGFGEVLADEVCGEAREGGEQTLVNGVAEGRWGWDPAG